MEVLRHTLLGGPDVLLWLFHRQVDPASVTLPSHNIFFIFVFYFLKKALRIC